MKNLRNEKGITLVALVVTIIVLLILAGVSLSLVAGGDGIIEKASTAVENTDVKTAEEAVQLKVTELIADYYDYKYVSKNSAELNGHTTVGAYVAAELNTLGTISGFTVSATNTSVTVTGSSFGSATATMDPSTGAISNWSK